MAAIMYSTQMNVLLFREVLSVNPFSYSRKKLLKLKHEQKPWEVIASSLRRVDDFKNKALSARSCREHTDRLCKQWKAENTKAFKSTGTDDEEISELKQLVEEVEQLIETGVEQGEEPLVKDHVGADVRNAAMETLAETKKRKDLETDGDDLSLPLPSPKRVSKANILSFMKSKTTAEHDLRQRELDLRQEALVLERKRLELQEKRDQEQAAERKLLLQLLSRDRQ